MCAGLLCLSGVFDGLGEETEEFLHAARELGHLLDHIEDVLRRVFLYFVGQCRFILLLLALWGFGLSLLVLSLYHLQDGLAIVLDGGVLLAFLHGHLLLGFVVDIVLDGLCVEGEGDAHDGQECEQLEEVAALGGFICHHCDSVFKGTVSDSVGKGVPADATGFCD